MSELRPFSAEQSRLLVNLRQRYETWMDAERERAGMPYDLRRKTVSGKDYLYRIVDRSGNGQSLGPMNQAFGRLKRFKRVALRCEKTAQNFASIVSFAAGLCLIKFVHTA
jgi:hypothetical protein